MRGNALYMASACIAAGLAMPTAALPQSRSTLPSAQTQFAIETLPLAAPDRGGVEVSAARTGFRDFVVDVNKLLPSAKELFKFDAIGQARTPLLVPNTVILQFKPDTPRGDIDSLLKKRNFRVLDTFPQLGAIKVQADLSAYFAPTLNDDDSNQTLLRGMQRVTDDLRSEPIVANATPDFVLGNQAVDEVPNLLKASDVGLAPVDDKGVADWGIANVEADKLWDLPGAQDGVLLGIMDVGFARHESLTFLELPRSLDVDDHGNHVSGIACGRRANGHGIHGVLPNCFIRANTTSVFFKSQEGGNIARFFVVFGQVLGTLSRFLGQYDDIKVINLSMGYNWQKNFAVNPDLPESSLYRSQVESQGSILVTALELASKSGKVIFSAAGNDSFGLATPVGAKYASPFNWAAITAREQGIARNGVIVEAHDSLNKRGSFSNVGGHISCPGVNITSAVAYDANGKPSASQYGKMSGTSMVSPYCAASHVLLSLVRPGYSGNEITDCLVASNVKSDTGAPIPKLTQALTKCPSRVQ
jgi:subtilisin family serine protease